MQQPKASAGCFLPDWEVELGPADTCRLLLDADRQSICPDGEGGEGGGGGVKVHYIFLVRNPEKIMDQWPNMIFC